MIVALIASRTVIYLGKFNFISITRSVIYSFVVTSFIAPPHDVFCCIIANFFKSEKVIN